MKFAVHTTDTADPTATEDLEAAAQTFRFVRRTLVGKIMVRNLQSNPQPLNLKYT